MESGGVKKAEIVVNGDAKNIYVLKADRAVSDYNLPCNLFLSTKVLAKAYELTVVSRLRGKSLKNVGLEFLRRLLLIKQVKDVIRLLDDYKSGEPCFYSVTEDWALVEKLVSKGTTDSLPGDFSANERAIRYYSNKLCMTSGEKNAVDVGELEEIVIAYQSLTIEDKWPKC